MLGINGVHVLLQTCNNSGHAAEQVQTIVTCSDKESLNRRVFFTVVYIFVRTCSHCVSAYLWPRLARDLRDCRCHREKFPLNSRDNHMVCALGMCNAASAA